MGHFRFWFVLCLKNYTWKRRSLSVISAAWVFVHLAKYNIFHVLPYKSYTMSLKGNPYLPSVISLNRNPYLGWQHSHAARSVLPFRACSRGNATNQCQEYDLGEAPVVNRSWVPDVAMIRTMLMYGKDRHGNPFPPPLPEELCEDIGVEGNSNGDTDKECLQESMIRSLGPLNSSIVTVSPANHYAGQWNKTNKEHIKVPSPKLMCLVYTMADAHANRILAIRDTWAGGCDGFLVFSTESDPRLPAIALEHEGPEAYGNMWQKVRSIWKFVGKHYLDEFDWFYIGGDDLFLLPHNLKTYLASLTLKDGTDPRTDEYFVGRRMNARGQRSGGSDYFNHGGPGYSLSHATLRKLLPSMSDARHCSANERTHMEDMMIARCLRSLGISVTDTRDAKGRERFHPFAPGWHFHWKAPGPPDQGAYYHFAREWGIMEAPISTRWDHVKFRLIAQTCLDYHQSFPSKRFDTFRGTMIIHLITGIVLIYSGVYIHIHSETSANGDNSPVLYLIMAISGIVHSLTVLVASTRVMGERRIIFPLYLSAGVVDLVNSISLIINQDLGHAFLLWGSVNTFILVRAHYPLLMLSNIDWELAYTYSIIAAAAISYPMSHQGYWVHGLFASPLVYAPFHELVCALFGTDTEDFFGGNKPSKKNIHAKTRMFRSSLRLEVDFNSPVIYHKQGSQ